MATDQEIRDAGFKYIPKQKYLQNPYELPVAPPPPPDGGITNTNAFTNSGGNDFSVYNPDPNTISNENYRPNYDYRRFSEYNSDPSTADIKQMDMNQNYFYPPEKSNFEKMLSKGINYIPGVGMAKKGLEFLGDQIGPYIPPNRRAIMENELSRQGIMVNDIGQIVQGQGDYNTAENIMAGYNANKVTQKTIDKRQGTIEKTLADKYNMSPIDIAAVKAGTYTGPVETDLIGRYGALDEFGNTLDLTNTKTDKIFDFEEDEKEKKKKNTAINRYLTNKKETKAAANAKTVADAQAAVTMQTNNFVPPSGITGGGRAYDYEGRSNQYGTHDSTISAPQAQTNQESYRGGNNGSNSVSAGSGGGASYSNSAKTGAKDGFGYGLKKGGRAGYFFGGRVNYKIGGVVHPDGRKGFFKGAQADTSKGESMSPGTDASGGFRGGDNDGGASDNPPVTVVNNNPVDISTVTKSVGNYEIPVGLEALMADKGRLQAVLNADNILDKNLGAEFTYDNGPYQVGFNADMEGDKSLNANYTRNNSNYSFDLNDGGGQFKFTKTFANGGLAGLL